MRIAVPFDEAEGEENIFQHFGKTQHFRLYDTDGQAVRHSQTIGTEGNGHGVLAPFLKAKGADTVICGGIGSGMQEALNSLGMKFYAGVSGNADEAVKKFLDGKLEYEANPTCNHEGGRHHG